MSLHLLYHILFVIVKRYGLTVKDLFPDGSAKPNSHIRLLNPISIGVCVTQQTASHCRPLLIAWLGSFLLSNTMLLMHAANVSLVEAFEPHIM